MVDAGRWEHAASAYFSGREFIAQLVAEVIADPRGKRFELRDGF
jgi:hypothetical protein